MPQFGNGEIPAMYSVKEKIYRKIARHPAGWVFSARDFLREFPRTDVDVSLRKLVQETKIRKVLRGFYDRPGYSKVLQEYLQPSPESVVKAIARRYSREIFPSGEQLLYYYGLSTQVPAQYVYLWDAPPKVYHLGAIRIEFRKGFHRDFLLRHEESRIAIQLLRALGNAAAIPAVQEKLKRCFTSQQWKIICSDVKEAPAHLHVLVLQLQQVPR